MANRIEEHEFVDDAVRRQLNQRQGVATQRSKRPRAEEHDDEITNDPRKRRIHVLKSKLEFARTKT